MAERYYYNSDRTILLSVDSSGMEAHLTLSKEMPFYNENELLSILEQAAIVSGFEEAKLFREREKINLERGRPFLLARGTPFMLPKANFNLLVKGEMIDRNLLFSNRLRFTDLEDKLKVTRDTPLGTFHATDSGKEGMDILGNLKHLPPNKIELCRCYAGENVIYDDENGQYVAVADGYLYLDEKGRLSIRNRIELYGEVNITRPGIQRSRRYSLVSRRDYVIYGNLIIHGNLTGPGCLNLKGDLLVTGSIKQCSLYIEGKTISQGKILNTAVISLNSVVVNSLVKCRICSGNDIQIEDRADYSLLIAEGSVINDSRVSECHNCKIYAGKTIKLRDCTHTAEQKSKLIISIAPFTKELIAFLKRRIDRLQRNPLTNKDTIEELQEELAELKEYLLRRFTVTEYQDNKIEVGRRILTGTYIRMLQYYRVLDSDFNGVSFYISNNKMVTNRKTYI